MISVTSRAGDDTFAQRFADTLARKGGKNIVFGSPVKVIATSPEVYLADFEWNQFHCCPVNR